MRQRRSCPGSVIHAGDAQRRNRVVIHRTRQQAPISSASPWTPTLLKSAARNGSHSEAGYQKSTAGMRTLGRHHSSIPSACGLSCSRLAFAIDTLMRRLRQDPIAPRCRPWTCRLLPPYLGSFLSRQFPLDFLHCRHHAYSRCSRAWNCDPQAAKSRRVRDRTGAPVPTSRGSLTRGWKPSAPLGG